MYCSWRLRKLRYDYVCYILHQSVRFHEKHLETELYGIYFKADRFPISN